MAAYPRTLHSNCAQLDGGHRLPPMPLEEDCGLHPLLYKIQIRNIHFSRLLQEYLARLPLEGENERWWEVLVAGAPSEQASGSIPQVFDTRMETMRFLQNVKSLEEGLLRTSGTLSGSVLIETSKYKEEKLEKCWESWPRASVMTMKKGT